MRSELIDGCKCERKCGAQFLRHISATGSVSIPPALEAKRGKGLLIFAR